MVQRMQCIGPRGGGNCGVQENQGNGVIACLEKTGGGGKEMEGRCDPVKLGPRVCCTSQMWKPLLQLETPLKAAASGSGKPRPHESRSSQ